jgi:hypothetical protein
MKTIMITLAFTLSTMIGVSQDIILKKSGDEIAATILEVGPTEIKYKDFGIEEGPILTILKSEIFMIKYKNGTREVFSEEEVIENATEYSEEEMKAKGKQDATINYRGRKSGAGATIATTVVLTPLIGIIPALACESTKPSFDNLNFPDNALMEDENYNRAYTQQAHRIKKKKIWKGFGIGSGVWLLIFLL